MAMTTGGGGAMSEINVTPLVDVMLVLLIIFMVAAPLIERERREQELQENRDLQQRLIELNLPLLVDDDTPPPQPDEETQRVQVAVGADLTVSINGEAAGQCEAPPRTEEGAGLGWQPCLDAIQGLIEAQPAAFEVGMTIDAAAVVPFGLLVGVIHRARQLGIENVGMMPGR